MNASPSESTRRLSPSTISVRPLSAGTVIVASASVIAGVDRDHVRGACPVPRRDHDLRVVVARRQAVHVDRRPDPRDVPADAGDRVGTSLRPGRRPEAEPVRTARDCHPRLGANDGGGDLGVAARALEVVGLDPLEGGLVARKLDQLTLRVEDVDQPVRPAPLLERVEVEADHVGLGDQRGVHAATPVQRGSARIEVIRQRQEREARHARRRSRQLVRARRWRRPARRSGTSRSGPDPEPPCPPATPAE